MALVIAGGVLLGCMKTAVAHQSYATKFSGFEDVPHAALMTKGQVQKSASKYIILADSERPAKCPALNDPYGSDFDWTAINSNEDLEMCLSELAENLTSIDRMAKGLETQGFTVVENYETGLRGVQVIWAEWDDKQENGAMPFDPDWSILKEWFLSRYSYAVSIRYTDGKPNRVIAQHQTK